MSYRFRRSFNREDKDSLRRQSREAAGFDIVTAPIRLLAKWGMSDYNPIDLSVKFYKKYLAKEDPDLELDDEGNKLDLEELGREARRREEAERRAFSYTPGVMEDLATGAPVPDIAAIAPSEQEIPPLQTVDIRLEGVSVPDISPVEVSTAKVAEAAEIPPETPSVTSAVNTPDKDGFFSLDVDSLFASYSDIFSPDDGSSI